MKIRVSATRMELLKLKRRLALAVRGHHLLKDKQDELVRQFFLRQENYRIHLRDYWAAARRARRSYDLLRGSTSRPALHLACQSAVTAPPLKQGAARVLNLSVPTYRWPVYQSIPLAGILEGAGPLENVLGDHLALLPLLARKAELEKGMQSILGEIEITKRRVNALEYKLIPSLRDSIGGISAKLSELELSTLTRLMRVKEIIEQGSTSAAGGSPEHSHGVSQG